MHHTKLLKLAVIVEEAASKAFLADAVDYYERLHKDAVRLTLRSIQSYIGRVGADKLPPDVPFENEMAEFIDTLLEEPVPF